ncbi:hypothetical protein Cantr_04825 [Candida viswanathii]|uniref:Uncharacterized protein n=1 Tax=Candida viswanathii TaxID=5486 RepID=A0A367XLK8_9ASCO|nr:hypothetical protein Cantr_04825 [Candida viswanathii]
MAESDAKSVQLGRHSEDVHSDEVIYSATLAHSVHEDHSISSHRELVFPSSANGQLSQALDLARPVSSRDLVIPPTSQEQARTGCLSWCARWFRSETSHRQSDEHLPLLPVYQVRSNTSPVTGQRFTGNLMEFLQRWLFRVVRRQYPNTFAWLMATFLTIFLISGILGLYYTGNMTGLSTLAKTLACSIFRQFQPSDVALPSFCRGL